MAYAQWVTITIIPRGFNAVIKNVDIKSGKLHKKDKKDEEISSSEINNKAIRNGKSYTIYACGRASASMGTEGSFDLYEGMQKVGSYRWDCPWGSKTNKSSWIPEGDEDDSNYLTQVSGANIDSGALGNVTLRSVRIK